MKMKEFRFDIELIIDHKMLIITDDQYISTHHTRRGYTLKELIKLIRINNVPVEDNTKITFIIRGVNY